MTPPDLPITRRMSYGDMRRALSHTEVTVASDLLPHDLMGAYIREGSVILIDRRLTYTQKRCTLVHELMHWAHADTACRPGIPCRSERRARRDTALFLIDASDYAKAEAIWEGDAYNIAAELDVTVPVLHDYQTTLCDAR